MITAIGNRLKEAREKKAISLDEVHAKIKIHPRIIQILEEEKFEKLPSPLFAKSFLRSYAEFLEVNPEEIVDAYDKQGKKPAPEQTLYIKTQDEKIREAGGFQKLGPLPKLIVAVLLCVGAILFISKNFHHWTEFISARSTKSVKSENSSKKEVVAAQASRASNEWLRSPELGNFPKIGAKQPLNLKIKALDNVWVHVTCDGKVLFQSILKKGATESWSADKSIQLWSGNSASMSLTLNGAQLGSPGKGSAKKMLITRLGVKAVA